MKFTLIKNTLLWFFVFANIQLFCLANSLFFSCSDIGINKIGYWAIVVGVGNYKNISVDTRYSVNDARDFSQQLERYYGFNHIKLVTDAAATKINVRSAVLDWLAPKEDRDDIVLFYFAGHGSAEYLRMYDSSAGNYDHDISSMELDE